MGRTRFFLLLPVATSLAACATTGPKTPGDPYEGFNRKVWSVNMAADKAIIRPVAKGYVAVFPVFFRRALSNVLRNVSEPFSAINATLQAKPKRALNTIGRFVINTTVGIGGIRDVASKVGYPPAPEDLGQTFAVWGAKKSSYLVLPLLGPSTIRDGVGSVASQWVDPYRILLRNELSFWPNVGVNAVEVVDARANLIDSGADNLLYSSADSYAVARSAYLQRREALIANRDDAAPGGGSGDAALDAALQDLDDGANTTPAATVPAPSLAPDQRNAGQPVPAPTLAPDQPTATEPAPETPADPQTEPPAGPR